MRVLLGQTPKKWAFQFRGCGCFSFYRCCQIVFEGSILLTWLVMRMLTSAYLPNCIIKPLFFSFSYSLCCVPEWSRAVESQTEERQGSTRSQWTDGAHTFSLWEEPSSVTLLSVLLSLIFFLFLQCCCSSRLYASNFKTLGKGWFLGCVIFFYSCLILSFEFSCEILLT